MTTTQAVLDKLEKESKKYPAINRVKQAVKDVSARYTYKQDKQLLLADTWNIMDTRQQILLGDCDDFALTCLWVACEKNIWKFIWNVLLLHRYRLYFSITADKQRHIVGYAEGLWFDNYTREAQAKNEFLYNTKHTIWFFFPSVFILWFMLLGKLL